MYLIIYKKGVNSEKLRMEFGQALTFVKANDMFQEAIYKYKQTGQSIKIGYKIIEAESGEIIFNSRININKDISSLFSVIIENSNAPSQVVNYITRVENREIVESDSSVIYTGQSEEKNKLEKLKEEKNNILQQLKKEEKNRLQRDLEYQQKMKEIQEEKKSLEKSIKLKEKEEEYKEAQRIEALRKLEEEKAEAIKLMEEKRDRDKRKTEEHEIRLKQVAEEVNKAEIELSSVETEAEKKVLERKKELQDLQNQKAEADMKAGLIQAQSEKEEVQYQQEISSNTTHSSVPENSDLHTRLVVPKLTFKEKLQEMDLEEAKRLSITYCKKIIRGLITSIKNTAGVIKNYYVKLQSNRKEKNERKNKELEIYNMVANEKVKFMGELKNERLKMQREMEKELRKKEKEVKRDSQIAARYRAVTNKRRNLFIPFKSIFVVLAFFTCGLSIIYYLNLGSDIAIISQFKDYIRRFFDYF